jgi:hypothetical protein
MQSCAHTQHRERTVFLLTNFYDVGTNEIYIYNNIIITTHGFRLCEVRGM